ncbi:MAG: hypothetical protein Kow0062_15090 [Acidobacteriota bacterium]
MSSLSGHRALVCGASRGIGLATARALAAAGASVCLLARDARALERAAAGIGGGAAALVADLDDPADAARRVAVEIERGGAFTILVNNAGGPAGGPLLDAEDAAFETAFRRHVLAAQALVRTLLPGMLEAGWGRIVNIVSTSVRQPIPGLGVSNTIRGAVASWAKTLAGELAPRGITVNNVLPGATRTERLEALIEARARREGRPGSDVADAMRAEIPMGRFAEPEEIAAAVAFLASPAAAYVTGVSLPVDGGRTRCL